MPRLRRDEEWARAMIERELDVPVVQHDDGSEPRLHDLDVLYPAAEAAAVEVTQAADPDLLAYWRAMDTGARWTEPLLAGGWNVRVPATARVTRLRIELPALLLELERIGRPLLEVPESGGSHVERRARGLRIIEAHQGGTDYPGSIYLTPEIPLERSGGWAPIDGDALATWLPAFLEHERPDVVAKLAGSGAGETHAFVVVLAFAPAPFAVHDLLMRDDAPLPTVDPLLPAGVTDVWVVGNLRSGVGFRWSASTGWRRFDNLQGSQDARE